ncbi:MAG: helix-turn-helix transcriptional regulator, partial [Negativibacillus sp.]|nr:helix-turn-helix transcriptional regulator [Negativibacillus sp.]
MIDYAAVGKRIAAIRKKQHMTQERLAEKTELSIVYISHIENSHSIPSLETLMKLCEVLNVTPDELLLGTRQDMENYLLS